MALLNRSTLKAKWYGLFPSNSTRQITASVLRDFVTDIADSALNKVEELYDEVRSLRPSIGDIGGLKTLVTSNLDTGTTMIFRDTTGGNVLRVYELVAGTDAESSPVVLRPNDYAATTNEKVWKLAQYSLDGGTP
jgi:hypothetical protein